MYLPANESATSPHFSQLPVCFFLGFVRLFPYNVMVHYRHLLAGVLFILTELCKETTQMGIITLLMCIYTTKQTVLGDDYMLNC